MGIPAPPPPAPQNIAQPTAPGLTTKAKGAGTILALLGALTALLALVLLAMVPGGTLEDALYERGFDIDEAMGVLVGWLVFLVAFGVLAVVAGIGIRRLNPGWRIAGIALAAIGALGSLLNGLSGALFALVFTVMYIGIVVNLARARAVFPHPGARPSGMSGLPAMP